MYETPTGGGGTTTIGKDRGTARRQLTSVMRARTELLHRQAEKSGVIAALLRRQSSRLGYALYMRNLVPAYRELERGLGRLGNGSRTRVFDCSALYRSDALAADLAGMFGHGWEHSLELLPQGRAYGDHVRAAAEADGLRLVAHAYVRYAGDLSGGQILKKLLSRSLDINPDDLSFYEFPEIADLQAFKAGFLASFDRLDLSHDEVDLLAEEACEAFRLNIAVSEAVQAAVT